MVRLRDVTLRDGLQDEGPIETDQKLSILELLVAAGVSDLELTSFTRPDRVPAMADADRLAQQALARYDSITLWGLVLNRRGAERALAAGLDHLQFVVSVSEPHNLENAARTVAASLTELQDIIEVAAGRASIEVVLATAFGCPYAGAVAEADVVDVAGRVVELGIERLSLADTIGTGVPTEVRSLVSAVRKAGTLAELGVHLHDTRGLALANALAAIEAGADRLDATVGGLGGCPFAPGASGNLALEDLVHALEAMGVPTGIDLDLLLEASAQACAFVGQAPTSHVAVAGPRFSTA
ncbi:MAG TPA: hydroxymethylglutaryl-CoA lyase [Acidimicrobiales bacterium]|jgi:hydroxymethylglutaryl-CoA lyase